MTDVREDMVVRGGSGEMFDKIAKRYDLLNRLMSFGVDRRWRRKTVDALELEAGHRVLDLATGTADLAIAIAKRRHDLEVIGVDPSAKMLEVGRRKVERLGMADRVSLHQGDAQALELATDSVDSVCIAFGIRNVPDRAQGLREMARVTKPGGRIAILELSEPRSGIMGPLARFHVHTVVPRLGALLSGAREYRYLQKSIEGFPPPDEFAALMEQSGMSVIEVRPFTFGVCCLYVATPAGKELA